MEINLMGFLVFILNKYNNENTFKYFITQSLGSVLLIRSSLFLENNFYLFTRISLLKSIIPLNYFLQKKTNSAIRHKIVYMALSMLYSFVQYMFITNKFLSKNNNLPSQAKKICSFFFMGFP